MALSQTICASDLYNIACNMGRGKKFTYKGWRAIGDYLESLSDDLGEDIEIDIVAICCDYSMAESVKEFWEEYGPYSGLDAEELEEMDDAEKLGAIRDYLNEKTSIVCCEDDLIIWQAF